jgi:nucleotide-binding universal stress UspA family protein
MVSIPERYIVGWDGSPGASAALDWALAQARGTHTKVHLLHAVLAIPPGPYGEVALDQGVYDDIAQAVLALGVDYVKEHAPDVYVTTERAYRGVTGALMDAARVHDVIVLGTRGYGGFMTMLVGSSCIQAANHSQVPVVVVHPREKGQPSYASAGPVVIAIDGTDSELASDAVRADDGVASAPRGDSHSHVDSAGGGDRSTKFYRGR